MRKTPADQPALFMPDTVPTKPAAKRTPRIRKEAALPVKATLVAKATSAKAPAAPAQKITSAVKSRSPRTPETKAIPVRAVTTPPLPVRVVAEKFGADGHAWRMSGKHAVAYLRNALLAGELLATDPRHLAKAAMAVYYDRKGKAFAWQVRFDAERWDEVVARLG